MPALPLPLAVLPFTQQQVVPTWIPSPMLPLLVQFLTVQPFPAVIPFPEFIMTVHRSMRQPSQTLIPSCPFAVAVQLLMEPITPWTTMPLVALQAATQSLILPP